MSYLHGLPEPVKSTPPTPPPRPSRSNIVSKTPVKPEVKKAAEKSATVSEPSLPKKTSWWNFFSKKRNISKKSREDPKSITAKRVVLEELKLKQVITKHLTKLTSEEKKEINESDKLKNIFEEIYSTEQKFLSKIDAVNESIIENQTFVESLSENKLISKKEAKILNEGMKDLASNTRKLEKMMQPLQRDNLDNVKKLELLLKICKSKEFSNQTKILRRQAELYHKKKDIFKKADQTIQGREIINSFDKLYKTKNGLGGFSVRSFSIEPSQRIIKYKNLIESVEKTLSGKYPNIASQFKESSDNIERELSKFEGKKK